MEEDDPPAYNRTAVKNWINISWRIVEREKQCGWRVQANVCLPSV